MEQIVNQMKVTISQDITSMEMQLNPENLGKIYVNISSEEGVVNAQFRATNEIVKEALEAQIATLRENLNQAGVKVDAIEVTIASHEFERNLEQNHHNPEGMAPACFPTAPCKSSVYYQIELSA
jgi:flagellar hook-length control protein FliK